MHALVCARIQAPYMHRIFFTPLLLAAMLFLASCKSNKVPGVPKVLPTIPLYGSTSTPSHRMSSAEYPFAPNGDYVTSWAAAGGTSPASSDYSSWRASHGGSSSSRGVTKVSSTRKSTASSSRSKSKSSSSRSVRHTVRSGDTLSGIARRYGSSVSKIKSANGLRSDLIRPGQTLSVPK